MMRIRNPRSRSYFLDAVKAYKAGAFRAAISSAWVVVIYDLISKYQELAASGDPMAGAYVRPLKAAIENRNTKKLMEIENQIVSDATKCQLLNPIVEIHLERFRADRNLCAHPAFYNEADLFEPSPELVRLHLVNAINLVLSQAPLQGKAISEKFDADIQSVGFPLDSFEIQNYVQQRYLNQTKPQNIKNFGIVLAKSLLRGVPDHWENHRNKVVDSLRAVQNRAEDAWPEVSSAILNILNGLEPSNRVRAISFLAAFPGFWDQIESSTKTALHQTVANTEPNELTDYRLLIGVKIQELKEPTMNLINALPRQKLLHAFNLEILPEFWPAALEFYRSSDTFNESESNFRDFILPFADMFSADKFDELLRAIEKNRQNWEAWRTPRLLQNLLRNTSEDDLPTHQSRDRFYLFLADPLQNCVAKYNDFFDLLRQDGWKFPDPPEVLDDDMQ